MRALNKFLPENVLYYCYWIWTIATLPLLSLKFLDEVTFDSTDCRAKKGVTAIGRRLITAAGAGLSKLTINCTLLTSLTHPQGFIRSHLRQGSNNAWDFCLFIIDLLDSGHLAAGDILVCDNASIHKAADMLDVLEPLLEACNVRLLFLPTYSPELNPCELVFGQVKRFLREQHASPQFVVAIDAAFNAVTPDNVLAYYDKCVMNAGSE